MEDIGDQNWERAHRLFQCVSVAARPLHVEELADILAFDFKVESTPTFRAERRSEDPVRAVLSTCSTLLAVVNVAGSRLVPFAHFSAQEYLTSTRLANAKDTISRFQVSMTPAHTIVAQTCLGVLLHLGENITEDSLKDFSLAEYAAKHWVDHARIENVSSKVEDGMKRLFDPSKIHLSMWVWIYDPESPRHPRRRFELRTAARATSLHYAAFCGFHNVATFLIVDHSQDVNARGFGRRETPLHVALRRGQVETARVLLKHDADTEARDKWGYSPLEHVAREGHADLAQVLLEHGADANSQDILTCTTLYRASEAGKLTVAQVLLSHGASATALCMNNETALHRAEDEEVARLLLQHSADANALDIKNRTPLHRVSGLGHVGAVRVLLEHGADANARDSNNATPLHLASNRVGNWYSKGGGEYLGVVQLLLQYSSDIHARDDKGQTPFMRATTDEHQEIMQLLLEHGAEDHRCVDD